MDVGNVKTHFVVSICVNYIDKKSHEVRCACCCPVSSTAEGTRRLKFFYGSKLSVAKVLHAKRMCLSGVMSLMNAE